jgi:large subunit ribosomal protein L9
MNVILLKDVEKVGLRGDVVSVTRGYARNFLLPRKLAEEATDARVAELRKREGQRARHEASTAEQAEAIAKTLRETVLRFEVKAGPTGALFGSVTPTNIADEIWRTRKVRIDRRKIDLENIKRIGRYDVPIDVFQDVRVEVKTLVVPEGGELPSDEELEAMAAAELAEQQAAAPPESGPAETVELLAEEVDAGPEDVAVESASDDFDETVEAAAENGETSRFPCKWREKTCLQRTNHHLATGLFPCWNQGAWLRSLRSLRRPPFPRKTSRPRNPFSAR